MATEVREHEERSHSARYLILIFLVCSATCGVFFSLGFLVGYNERTSRSAPSTEVVTAPPVIPPTVNPPPEGAPGATQDPTGGHASPNSGPETEVVPPAELGVNPPSSGAKAADTPPGEQSPGAAKPGSNAPTPAAGAVGEGITLQVAAMRTKQDAEVMVNVLKTGGYPVFLVTPEFAQADDNLFRVLVGPFKTRDDAEKVRAELAKKGFKPFIRH